MWRPAGGYRKSEERGFLLIARNQTISIVAGVVLIAAAITAPLLVGRDTTHSSPEAVVRSYLIAVYEKGDASQFLDLIDPQDLDELEVEYGIGRDEMREGLQDSLDEFHRELASEGISLTWEVGSTTAQNRTAETIATVRFNHPVLGDDESTQTIPTLERDGRWYLGVELLEVFLSWFLSREY